MSSPILRSTRSQSLLSKEQQRRLEEERIPVRPGLTLRQQIELQHLQQLVPWSTQQPNINPSEASAQGKQAAALAAASVAGSVSSGESQGPSQWEVCVKRLSESGAFRKIRRSSSSRALVVARLPDAFESLTQPISICKDVPVQGTIEALPVSEWLAFERKLFTTAEPEAEKAPPAAATAVDMQVLDKLRRSVRNFDENEQPLPSSGAAAQEDELGLEREKRRQLKRIMKARGESKTDEYISSALSVKSLTKNETVSWDFEEGPRSDDEDLQDNLDGLNAAPESKGDKAGAEGPLIFDGTDGAFSDGEDADGQGTLSSFGQKMKHLLEKAKEDEADAELHQYASEDDDEASVASRQQDVSAVARLRAETLRQAAFLSQEGEDKAEGGGASSSVSSSAAAGHGASSAVFSAAAASGGSDGGANAAESLEARVIRVMQQHMGRMAVKDFMAAFKVKQKNEEFRRIQAVVHKVCKMEATEDKQKFIVLKPEYRI